MLLRCRGGDVEVRQLELLLCEIQIERHDSVDDFDQLGDHHEQRGLNDQDNQPPDTDQDP